jgi:hypothetical protein
MIEPVPIDLLHGVAMPRRPRGGIVPYLSELPWYSGEPIVRQFTGATAGPGLATITNTTETCIDVASNLDCIATIRIENQTGNSVNLLVGSSGQQPISLSKIYDSQNPLTFIGNPAEVFVKFAGVPASTDVVIVLITAPPFPPRFRVAPDPAWGEP